MDIGFWDWKIKDELKNEQIRKDYIEKTGSDISCPSSIINNIFNPNKGIFEFKDDFTNKNNGF